MRYAMSLLGALLQRMRDQCRKRKVQLYVLKQHDPAGLRIFHGQLVAYEGRAYRLATAPVEAEVRSTLKGLDIPLLDVALDHRRHTFLPHDFHLNGAGYAYMAEKAATWLRRKQGFRVAEARWSERPKTPSDAAAR